MKIGSIKGGGTREVIGTSSAAPIPPHLSSTLSSATYRYCETVPAPQTPDLFTTSNRPAGLRAPRALSVRLDDARSASPPASFLARSVESCAGGVAA
jgi:hypothetical protein